MNTNSWFKKGLLFVCVAGSVLAPCAQLLEGSSPFGHCYEDEECVDRPPPEPEQAMRNMHPELQIAAPFNQCDE